MILLLLFGAHLVSAGTHSLRYVYTAVSGVNDFPEFTAVGLVDEGPFMYFDSKMMKAVPKTEWMRQSEGADYWDRETQIGISHLQSFKNNIWILKARFNQTTGVHTVQWMYGCELDTDGTKRGYMQFGYDGEDFISLDKDTLTWTAANPQAVITKHKWEADRAFLEQRKAYLENTCIEWLQKYVGYGKDTLERKVSPQVSVLKKSSSSPVVCHATGFYPKEVTISWMKNDQEHHDDVDLGELLPNEDGTFQKTSELRVTPEELKNNQFICVVEHQGKTFREILTDDSLPIIIIVGVVLALILLAVIGVVVFKVYQKKKGFRPVNASDDGSNSSARTDPQA
ncbi:H-2 class I histocompatibility antigen, Q9 alpha chain isoform X2 [Carassius gibelio]|uniref:H-2 class I histocompatibility antigen, Q9 alpha chain isoform X2 n=1 Tax=Carassius gibelio TaxID=101364 RepID=UPI0022781F17|nr:H-2 class I histocompatibility antigen, Q9 alpha chain isoform X2 [Carassius gibelio]